MNPVPNYSTVVKAQTAQATPLRVDAGQGGNRMGEISRADSKGNGGTFFTDLKSDSKIALVGRKGYSFTVFIHQNSPQCACGAIASRNLRLRPNIAEGN
jgi:hypothetical protein